MGPGEVRSWVGKAWSWVQGGAVTGWGGRVLGPGRWDRGSGEVGSWVRGGGAMGPGRRSPVQGGFFFAVSPTALRKKHIQGELAGKQLKLDPGNVIMCAKCLNCG